MKRLFKTLGSSAAVICLSMAAGVAVFAGKPTPTPSVPKGTIYVGINDIDVLQMQGDGSSKSYAPYIAPTSLFGGWIYPDGSSAASHGKYGGQAWWIVRMKSSVTNDYVLYATKDGNSVIPLATGTNVTHPDGSKTRVNLSSGFVQWGAHDSFCSITGTRRETSADGVVSMTWVLYRIDIGVTELEYELAHPGTIQVASDGDPRFVPVLYYAPPTDPGVSWGRDGYAWSLDGSMVAFTFFIAPNGASDLYLANVAATPVDFQSNAVVKIRNKVFTNGVADGVLKPEWSPLGDRILCSLGDHILSLRLDGTTAFDLATNGTDPHWSPDAGYVVYTQRVLKGFTNKWNICRVPATGGTVLNLTSDLDANVVKGALGWRD